MDPQPPPVDERAQPADVQQAIDKPFLPKLTHIDPVIFVLAQDDFTRPTMQPAQDRVERVKRMLETIDAYKYEVRVNFHHLVRQEKRRIEQSSLQYEQAHKAVGETEPDVSINDERGIMAAMDAPVDPKTTYNIEGTAQQLRVWERFHGEEEPFNRENSLRQLGLVAEEGIHHIDEFLMHMASLRAKWETVLEREQIALEGFVGAARPTPDEHRQ
ncbi:hypothetical protein RB595_004597 [Gaeumannomyces hyphopodioides]